MEAAIRRGNFARQSSSRALIGIAMGCICIFSNLMCIRRGFNQRPGETELRLAILYYSCID